MITLGRLYEYRPAEPHLDVRGATVSEPDFPRDVRGAYVLARSRAEARRKLSARLGCRIDDSAVRPLGRNMMTADGVLFLTDARAPARRRWPALRAEFEQFRQRVDLEELR